MTLEERKAINRAWLDGKMVQFETENQAWRDFGGSKPDFCNKLWFGRIMPGQKLRPWTQKEFPHNALFRAKGDDGWSKCFGISSKSVIFVSDDLELYEQSFESLLKQGDEHSTDDGKTWKPCGVEE